MTADHHGHIDVEPVLVADALEPERDIFGGPAEDGIGDRERQRDAERADVAGNSSAFTTALIDV